MCQQSSHSYFSIMIYLRFLLAFFIFLGSLISCNDVYSNTSVDGDHVIKRISELAKSAKAYTADFKIVTKTNGSEKETQGHLTFKWPNMVREEHRLSGENSENELIVSNGRVKWIYIPRAKLAYKYNLEEQVGNSPEISDSFMTYINPKLVQYVGNSVMGQDAVHILETKPDAQHEMGLIPSESGKLFVGVQDGLLRKVVIYDAEKQEIYSQTFWNVKSDPSISSEQFEFLPPKDVFIHEMKK